MLNRFFNLIRNLFIKNEVKRYQSDSIYDEEIKNKERHLELFHKIVGENPLKQIDWIIENGFEKFNQWYKSYEDGSISNSTSLDYSEFANQMHMLTLDSSLTSRNYAVNLSRAMEIGFTPGAREDKEVNSMLRQSLSARDYRMYSPANQIGLIEYESISHGALVFVTKSKVEYRWEKQGDRQQVSFVDLEDIRKSNSFFSLLETVNNDSCITLDMASKFHDSNRPETFGELFDRVESTQVIEQRGGLGNEVIARYEEVCLDDLF